MLWLEAEPGVGVGRVTGRGELAVVGLVNVHRGSAGVVREERERFHIWSPARQVSMQVIHGDKPPSTCGLIISPSWACPRPSHGCLLRGWLHRTRGGIGSMWEGRTPLLTADIATPMPEEMQLFCSFRNVACRWQEGPSQRSRPRGTRLPAPAPQNPAELFSGEET